MHTPKSGGLFPVLVDFHGDGWVIAGTDAPDASCRALGNAIGCALVSYDYRRAREKAGVPVENENAVVVTHALFGTEAVVDKSKNAIPFAVTRPETGFGNLLTPLASIRQARPAR
ncbi:hypothetical protein FRUB_09446 [Fimbriiglobus ruber]|uniref:Alpha/beta hydrolase fold-3 domain-containing protein n=1 Tax=Fimbriiglobus ruber TaxID=1908690 RepID=A0A225DFV9_9BACT|nr:hypothetical protein FRUB_09446 [Fimbriiglobus ruber]